MIRSVYEKYELCSSSRGITHVYLNWKSDQRKFVYNWNNYLLEFTGRSEGTQTKNNLL